MAKWILSPLDEVETACFNPVRCARARKYRKAISLLGILQEPPNRKVRVQLLARPVRATENRGKYGQEGHAATQRARIVVEPNCANIATR